MKLLLGLIAGLMATSAAAQDARKYEHDGLYPRFDKNGMMNTTVELKRNFYVKNCVTVSKEPIDRTCDVRVGNFREEIDWKAPIIRETVWSGGRDMKMTWLFAAADREAVAAALDTTFGPLPAEIARPNTWCAFQGVFQLENMPEGVLVRFTERMNEGHEWQQSMCGNQIATRAQTDALEQALFGAEVNAIVTRHRVRR